MVRKSSDIDSSEITPKSVYLNRRNFMKGAVGLGAAAFVGHKLYRTLSPEPAQADARKISSR